LNIATDLDTTTGLGRATGLNRLTVPDRATDLDRDIHMGRAADLNIARQSVIRTELQILRRGRVFYWINTINI
jgi:hypothetical protein